MGGGGGGAERHTREHGLANNKNPRRHVQETKQSTGQRTRPFDICATVITRQPTVVRPTGHHLSSGRAFVPTAESQKLRRPFVSHAVGFFSSSAAASQRTHTKREKRQRGGQRQKEEEEEDPAVSLMVRPSAAETGGQKRKRRLDGDSCLPGAQGHEFNSRVVLRHAHDGLLSLPPTR